MALPRAARSGLGLDSRRYGLATFSHSLGISAPRPDRRDQIQIDKSIGRQAVRLLEQAHRLAGRGAGDAVRCAGQQA